MVETTQEPDIKSLEEENEALRSRLALLVNVVRRAQAGAGDLPSVLQRVLEGACEMAGARCGALAVVRSTGTLDLYTHNISQQEAERGEGSPWVEQMAEWFRKSRGPARLPAGSSSPKTNLLESELRVNDETVGSLCVAGPMLAAQFSSLDRDLFAMFAAQIMAVLRTSRLNEETRQQLDEAQRLGHEMQALHAVTRLSVSSLDMEDVLALSLPLVMDAAGAQSAEIWLVDNGAQTLELRAQQGQPDGFFNRASFEMGEGLPGMAAEALRHVSCLDISDSAFCIRGEVADYGFSSLCAFPLVFQDQPIGVLCVACNGPDCLGEAHNRLLERMADGLAVAIQNAQLFSMEQQARLEAQEAQRALVESESRNKAILNSSTAVVFLKDLEGRYLFMNQRFKDLFHMDPDFVTGKTDHEIFPYEAADTFRCHDKQVMEAGGQIEFEELIPHDDGLHTYLSLKFPLYNSEGVPYAVCGISTDITERKRMEQRLFQERERLHGLVETSPVGVLVAELIDSSLEGITVAQEGNERVMVLNQEGQRMLGVLPTPADTLGQYEQDLTFRRPDGRAYTRMELPLQRALYSAETVRSEEVVLQFADGRSIPTLVNATPLYSPDGSVMAAVAVIQDISKLKETEQAKDDFFSMITHDLKSPLTTIKGLTSSTLIDARGEEVAMPVEWVRTIEAEVDHLATLVTNLLDVSRLQARGMSLEQEECQILELVTSSLQDIRGMRAYAHREIALEVPADLPPVFADYNQLRRVLTNLVVNAAQYSPPETAIVVRATVGDEENALDVEVIDHGPGIPQEEHSLIFEKFYRGASHYRNRRHGTGLGLAICRAIVEAHGGKISVSSEPGSGSTFRFSLPLKLPGE